MLTGPSNKWGVLFVQLKMECADFFIFKFKLTDPYLFSEWSENQYRPLTNCIVTRHGMFVCFVACL